MATETSVSLSTVSLRLIKQPEHRPEFEKKLAEELRERLGLGFSAPITTMPDLPGMWQLAKKIAERMETEKKYAEEHPECAKSPNGKHEWRFGTCVWCGKSATEVETEVKPEMSSGFHVEYIDLSTGKRQEKTIPEKEQYDLYRQQREGKISIISIKPETKSEAEGIKATIQEKLTEETLARRTDQLEKAKESIRNHVERVVTIYKLNLDEIIDILDEELRRLKRM